MYKKAVFIIVTSVICVLCALVFFSAFNPKQTTRNLSYEENITVRYNDKDIDIKQRVQETDNYVQYETAGNTVNLDKNTLFSEKCAEVLSKQTTKQEDIKPVLKLVLLQKYLTSFVDWCNPYDMQDFASNIIHVFQKSITESTEYLIGRFGENYIECTVNLQTQARRHQYLQEVESFYSELLKEKLANSKRDFCEQLNSGEDIFLEILVDLSFRLTEIEETDLNVK